MKKVVVLATLIALVLLAGVFAARAGEGGFHGRMMAFHGGPGGHEEMLADALDLTDQQKTAARQLHEELMTQGKPLMEQARQQWDEVEKLLQTSNPDPTEVGEKVIAMHAVHQQLKTLHDELATRFSALLNDEQKAKFQQLREAHDRFPGPGGPGF